MGLMSLFNIVNGHKETTDTDYAFYEPIPARMFKDKTLSGDAIKLYGLLGSEISELRLSKNGDYRVFPSFKEIEANTGWKNKKIGKIIDELVEHGWISRIDTPLRFHYQNNYYLAITPEINQELVNRRNKKHKKQSASANKRIAEKKLENDDISDD